MFDVCLLFVCFLFAVAGCLLVCLSFVCRVRARARFVGNRLLVVAHSTLYVCCSVFVLACCACVCWCTHVVVQSLLRCCCCVLAGVLDCVCLFPSLVLVIRWCVPVVLQSLLRVCCLSLVVALDVASFLSWLWQRS